MGQISGWGSPDAARKEITDGIANYARTAGQVIFRVRTLVFRLPEKDSLL
jgi:hypothetical protein